MCAGLPVRKPPVSLRLDSGAMNDLGHPFNLACNGARKRFWSFTSRFHAESGELRNNLGLFHDGHYFSRDFLHD